MNWTLLLHDNFYILNYYYNEFIDHRVERWRGMSDLESDTQLASGAVGDAYQTILL